MDGELADEPGKRTFHKSPEAPKAHDEDRDDDGDDSCDDDGDWMLRHDGRRRIDAGVQFGWHFFNVYEK